MDSRIAKMAQAMITYSTAVKSGECVLIRASSPAAEPLVQALYQEALRAGAFAFTYVHLRDEERLALEATRDTTLLEAVNPMLEVMYQTCDVIIALAADENLHALEGYPLESQQALSRGGNALRRKMIERDGARSLRRCSAFVPTQAYAERAGMSLQEYQEFFYQGCKLHLDDPVAAWREFAGKQQHLVEYLKDKKHLHVRGKNVDLDLSIAGRTFVNAAGQSNFPDGEIYTGPVEGSVNGWVKFTYPAYYGSNEVRGTELTFKDGVVIHAKAVQNEQFLLTMLDTDPGARRVGEFAIGTNYDIQRFTGSIVFDEKIGGTMHLAVGQAYPLTGSLNTSAIHWDMIYDMRDGGEITADGEVFYRNGEFLI